MPNKETLSEEIIVIQDIEELRSKAGRLYHKVFTDKGDFTCFEDEVVAILKTYYDEKITVEIATNDRGFKNIRRYISSIPNVKMGETKQTFKVPEVHIGDPKTQTMYTSYAKDIFIALVAHRMDALTDKDYDELMHQAITQVIRAKEAFK